jgi:hypothetical protein
MVYPFIGAGQAMRKMAGRLRPEQSSFEATGDPAMAIPAFIGLTAGRPSSDRSGAPR